MPGNRAPLLSAGDVAVPLSFLFRSSLGNLDLVLEEFERALTYSSKEIYVDWMYQPSEKTGSVSCCMALLSPSSMGQSSQHLSCGFPLSFPLREECSFAKERGELRMKQPFCNGVSALAILN